VTPTEKRIAKSLIAVAWVDGKVDESENDIVKAVLTGFDANENDANELLAYAKTRRTLDDIPVKELEGEHRELLLGNAALLTRADGIQDSAEKDLLKQLGDLLGFSAEQAKAIVESAKDGALRLPKDSLVPEGRPKAPSQKQ